MKSNFMRAVLFSLALTGLAACDDPPQEPPRPPSPPTQPQPPAPLPPVPQPPPAPVDQVEMGKNIARRCAACHAFEQSAGPKMGPNLFGVYDRQVGSVQGFSYSDALEKKGESGANWNDEALTAFLKKPQEYAPGTKMTFPGMTKQAEIDALIAYLKTLKP